MMDLKALLNCQQIRLLKGLLLVIRERRFLKARTPHEGQPVQGFSGVQFCRRKFLPVSFLTMDLAQSS